MKIADLPRDHLGRIEPGTYEIDAGEILPPGVWLVGSGRDETIIFRVEGKP